MKFLVSLFVLSATFVATYASLAREETDDTKKHPGYCFSQNTTVGAMEKDEIKQLDGCVQATCGEGRVITYFGCGTIGAEPPCKVVEGDSSKPYPECCPDVKC